MRQNLWKQKIIFSGYPISNIKKENQRKEGNILTDRYIYPEDFIKYELDNALVGLYDIFRDFLFSDTDEYYRELKFLPLWIQHAGQDSDFSFSAEDFREYIVKSDFPDMGQGHLSTVKNRTHFFSSNIKVNDILPKIHREFKMRMLETISQIKRMYVMDE